jgi:feruloyl esterase
VFTKSCRIYGTIATAPSSTITWSVEVPEPSEWNGKTITLGGGGYDGFIPTDSYVLSYAGAAANNFVRISSDSGHQTTDFFPWGNDDVALKNHAYEANHQVLAVGTRIALEMFGKAPTRRYMFGQSNGGRAGLAAAQHYPDDYDGIISLSTAISQQAHQANVGPVIQRFVASDPANWMSRQKLTLYSNAEIAACDGLDGLADGVISNIEACHYVPTALLCPPDMVNPETNNTCLTQGQIDGIAAIYADKNVPVVLTRGEIGYPRFGRGGAAMDWTNYIYGSSFANRSGAFNYFAVDQASKVLANDGNASVMTFDPTQYQAQFLRLATEMDTTDPDLSRFAARGGKLIIWYGTADACVSMYRVAQYYDEVRRTMGADKVQAFSRFLTTPHVGHDLSGPGPNTMDLITAMDDWVENDQAPDHVISSKVTGGVTRFTRPMCSYPMFPRYKGSGDETQAENFFCSAS